MKRTTAQRESIYIASNLSNMLKEIRDKFVLPNKIKEYETFCEEICSLKPELFNPKFIEDKINLISKQKKEDQVEAKKKKIQILQYNFEDTNIFLAFLKMQEFKKINLSNNNFKEDEILEEIRKALNYEDELHNNIIQNKIFVGALFRKLKPNFEDTNIFLAFLKMQEFKITKSEVYFAMDLCKLNDDYPRISMVSVPLRFLKTNFKIIKEITKSDNEFWKTAPVIQDNVEIQVPEKDLT